MSGRRCRAALWGCGLLMAGMGLLPPAYRSAIAGEGQSTLEMTKDADRKTAALDRKLERLVGELRKTTARDSSTELRDLQARWKRLARAECQWESRLGDGGSVAPLVYTSCMEKRLNARIQQLKPLLCEGAGMTGSCAASERY